ncbi:hypothetical protein Tco_0343050, partial [Tanacetum coccineum]
AYTSQIVVMAMMALAIGADTVSTEQRRKDIIESLINLPVMAMMALEIGADTVSTEQRREDIIQSLINLPNGPELKIDNKDTGVDAVLTGKGFLEMRCKY